MGRLEAFALGHKPWESFLDGVGNGVGYGMVLLIIGFVRELFGNGSLFGFRVIPQSFYDMGYANFGLMNMAPMALIILACVVWVQRSYNKNLQEA